MIFHEKKKIFPCEIIIIILKIIKSIAKCNYFFQISKILVTNLAVVFWIICIIFVNIYSLSILEVWKVVSHVEHFNFSVSSIGSECLLLIWVLKSFSELKNSNSCQKHCVKRIVLMLLYIRNYSCQKHRVKRIVLMLLMPLDFLYIRNCE